MTDQNVKRVPILSPKRNHPDDQVSAVISAGMQAVPALGGMIARLGEELIPSQAEKSRVKWEGEISERTNENSTRLDLHDELLAPKATLSEGATQLAIALAKQTSDGMRGKARDLDDLCKLVPEASKQVVEDAAFELSSYGLIEITRAVGRYWWLHLTQHFYQQIDHAVMGWNTEDDSASLAKLLIERNELSRTSALHAASGWEKRRFNPAFGYLLQFLPDGRVSREIQPNYPATQVHVLQEDKAVLRRFIASRIAT